MYFLPKKCKELLLEKSFTFSFLFKYFCTVICLSSALCTISLLHQVAAIDALTIVAKVGVKLSRFRAHIHVMFLVR